MNITFEESATEFVLEAFGWGVNDDGLIVDDGKPVIATDGREIYVDELGGIVKRAGHPLPMRDDFSSIVDEVEYRAI